MSTKNFDYEVIKKAETENLADENPIKAVINKAEGFYLYDETDKGYLDLTSNDDYMPLGFSAGHKNTVDGFFDSDNFRAKDFLKLETLLKETVGFEKAYISHEKSSAYNLLKKIISTKPEKSVLISSLEKDNFSFEDKELINIHLNNSSEIKTFLNRNTAAVIIEITQITDFLNVAEIDYLKLIKDSCAKNNALLVYDTCSVSPLRLNRGLFNFDESIRPDVLISSKGLSTISPLYMVLYDNEIPEDSSRACSCRYTEAVDFIQNNENYRVAIQENSAYMEKKFRELSERHIALADVISYGMMYALVTEIPSCKIVKEMLDRGFILKPLNTYTVLLVPPYIIEKKEIDRFIKVLDELFDKLAQYDRLGE